jgi:hypothetical protein
MAQEQPVTPPGPYRIGRNEETERLYDLEEQLHAAVKACATEWLKVTKEDGDLWHRGIAQALFDLLGSMQGGEEAARAFVAFRDAGGRP